MRNKIIGLFILIISITFIHEETLYFGNNLVPKSLHEFLCDFVGIVSASVGFRFFNKKQPK